MLLKQQKFTIKSVTLSRIFLAIIILGLVGLKSNILEANDYMNKSFKIPGISGLQGGYLPKNAIVIGDFKLACIVINTNSDKIGEILFEIKDKNEKSYVKFFPCLDFTIDSNKLLLKSTTTKIGDISFTGVFMPVKNGNYMNVSWDTIVLKGKLTITKGGKNLYSKANQEFTFLYGD